ncbi:endonuclease [Thalassobacillus devorans]|uniref:Endonuclease n=1 Tax=Thalassobacillus devorans TaxID=279813 RepID=A0ABQ1NJ48_9BACI|nr:endonuclease/exonuclease/phosphatase family protein [Thalassobacillus devorans]NIK27455.1 endonuclease/exonuclease/phosphatase family metal-dependent hydrolase [Thalassobacillus devorans]GGC77863.1 endonuclease [Thalassobacillus devorans]
MDRKLVTFNLRVDLPQDGENSWVNRVDKVARIIRKHQPMVFGAQEALLLMINNLEGALFHYRWIGEGRRGGMSDEFCPIFYDNRQLEVVDSGQFWLSEQPDVPDSVSWKSDFPRICTWGRFRFIEEPHKDFLVFNTHLDHVSQQARENGIALIWKRLHNQYIEKKTPIVLMGDLNSKPDNQVIQFLQGQVSLKGNTCQFQNAYDWLGGNPGRTFHQFEGGTEGEPIDYIFCTKKIKGIKTEIDRTSYDGRFPSDHYPVITSLSF